MSITTMSMISPLVSTGTPLAAPAASKTAGSAADPLASKDMFLQLLIAQLKYQNPDNPADGTQFVTQLAQFSQLEQATQMVSDLDQIKTLLTQATAPPPPPANSSKP